MKEMSDEKVSKREFLGFLITLYLDIDYFGNIMLFYFGISRDKSEQMLKGHYSKYD